MATAKYDPGINSSNPYAILTVTEKSYNVENNTSVIAWDLKLYRPYSISSSASKDYKVVINGATVKSGTTTIGGSGTKTIASGTKTIAHNSDGTKTISFSFSLEFAITWSGTYIGTGSKSGSLKLTDIPRATTPTVSATSVEFGKSITITMSRAISSFTHTLKYTFKGSTSTIESGLGTSKAWTIPLSLMDKIPNETSGTLTFTCETYNGSTKIGSKTVNITVKVPDTVIPTVSFTVAEYVNNIKNTFGIYVKGLSRLNINATGSGVYGSTIKSYKITANGETFTDSSAITSVLKSSGSLSINVIVTDSRGRSAGALRNITVSDYHKPIIEIFEGVRCDADGTENDEGENVLLTLKGSVTKLGGNTARYRIGYKESSSNEDYQYITLPVTSLSINQTYIINNIDTDKSYYIQFVITDVIGNGEPLTIPISTAFSLIDYHSSGKGLRIGGVAELEGVLDVDLLTYPRGGFKMPVLKDETDLNDVTTPNIYACNSSTTAGYINSPVTTATSFTLEVMSAGNSGQLIQRVTTCTKTSPIIYERFYYSDSWSEWIRIFDFGGKILWSGGYYMTAGHTIDLSANPISKQPSGIVLVFSEYADGEPKDQAFHHKFIPKYHVSAYNGCSEIIQMSTGNLAYFATKVLYIHNDKIVGHDNNGKTVTGACGITATNNRFVLRYVIGV